jgi:hypothetical protein
MNYIPGFSNYLEASVPEYGPAPIMDAEPAVPQRAMVEPTTQEAAAPYNLSGLDLSGLNNLYGMNFGTDFGGGAMGGIYPDDPNTEYIAAPLSNKGNFTAQSGNAFVMGADQPVRLVDLRTNQVVFEGAGYDAARQAVAAGQNLSDTLGRKAQYVIQTADPSGAYTTVANEKSNKSTLGEIANVAGTVLPLAMMAIPGVNAALLGANFAKTLGGQLAFGALTGGASSALKGQNVLKGAALGGLTAAGGALIPKIPAIGDLGKLAKPLGVGLGATAGGLATGKNLQNSLLGGVASGALAYAAPSIQDAIKGIGQGPNVGAGSTGASAASGPAPIATVTGNTGFSAPVPIGGGSSPSAKPAELEPPATIVSGSGLPFAAAFPIPASVLSGVNPSAAQPKPDQMSEEDIIKVTGERLGAVTPNVSIPTNDARGPLSSVVDGVDTATREIVAEGNRFRNPLSPNVVIPDSALSPEILRAVNGPDEEIIKVTGQRSGAVSPYGPIFGLDTPLPDMTQPAEADKKLTAKDIADYLRLASLGVSTIGGLLGGDKGGNSGGKIPAGMGALSSLFSKQLPASTLPGGVSGGALPASTLASQGMRSPQNYYRYGYGPEQSFFDYATQGAPNTSRAYTGYEGTTAEDAFAPQPVRAPQVALPQPVTTPVPNNPAGPSMYAPAADDMRFARGGFAVEGAGDGRDDKIPALLSDGEYVIDAETVALLGNGSNKAGAKLLDSFRVKVRKQKGKKLARGKFSDNAKRPEQYLAGGPA